MFVAADGRLGCLSRFVVVIIGVGGVRRRGRPGGSSGGVGRAEWGAGGRCAGRASAGSAGPGRRDGPGRAPGPC